MYHWEPYIQRSPRLRVIRTSCCGEYELASEGGQYFVLRPADNGAHEETARGLYAHTVEVWKVLVSQHRCSMRAS